MAVIGDSEDEEADLVTPPNACASLSAMQERQRRPKEGRRVKVK